MDEPPSSDLHLYPIASVYESICYIDLTKGEVNYNYLYLHTVYYQLEWSHAF